MYGSPLLVSIGLPFLGELVALFGLSVIIARCSGLFRPITDEVPDQQE